MHVISPPSAWEAAGAPSASFAEGSLGPGCLCEMMNPAELWKLPVIYACENNLFNEDTHHSETTRLG